MFRVLAIGACLLAVAGCESVRTAAEVDTYDVVPDKQGLQSGIAYYVPKNLVRINFIRSSRSVSDAAKALTSAKVKAAQIATRIALAEAAAEQAELEAVAAGPSVAAELRKVADLKKAAFDAAKKAKVAIDAELKNAQTAFDRALATGRTRVPTADSISIAIEPAVADTRYRFTLQDARFPTQDSRYTIVVTDKGLLSLVSAKVQDRLPEIVSNLSRAAISAASGFPPGPPQVAADGISTLVMDPQSEAAAKRELDIRSGVDEASSPSPDAGVEMRGVEVVDRKHCPAGPRSNQNSAERKPVEKPDSDEAPDATTQDGESKSARRRRYNGIVCNCPRSVRTTVPAEATWIIDPSRYSSVLSVNCELQKLGSNLRVRILRWPDARKSHATHLRKFERTYHAGVVYRAPTDYKAAIIELKQPIQAEVPRPRGRAAKKEDSEQKPNLLAIVREEHNFVLPNGGPLRTLPFRYSLCSVAGYQVQFVDGMPVRQQIDHRSELAACSAIPLQIIGDIIEAPINMFDFQTKRLQKEKSLIDARKALDESRRLPGPPPTD